MKKLTQVPTLEDIQQAHQAIAPFIHRTPVLTSQFFDQKTGAQIFFKCENFQKVGAFKMRGACCAVLAMTAAEKAKGITTHSSGNHGQAVARSAQIQGIKAYIVMPKNAPQIKVDAVRSYGAEVIFCHSSQEGREEKLAEVVAQTGATFVHPYNNYNVIAGQATAAKELLEEIPDLDILMSPVGGGGLASGSALMTHYADGKVRMIGSEPKGADDAFRSLQSGQMQKNEQVNTIADGLRTNIKEKTFGILKEHAERIITVSDEEIVVAMRMVWERMKIIIEPSCSVPVAAVLQQPELFHNQKIGIILTGGNVDLNKLPF
ncbi:MAG: pyridoxal-phosphate dependent enzyme [Bacteroidota bacterium]